MKYTTAQDVKLGIEFVPQNFIEFYSPPVENVHVKLARVMSEQKVPRSVEQQYGEECLLRRHSSPYCCWSPW